MKSLCHQLSIVLVLFLFLLHHNEAHLFKMIAKAAQELMASSQEIPPMNPHVDLYSVVKQQQEHAVLIARLQQQIAARQGAGPNRDVVQQQINMKKSQSDAAVTVTMTETLFRVVTLTETVSVTIHPDEEIVPTATRTGMDVTDSVVIQPSTEIQPSAVIISTTSAVNKPPIKPSVADKPSSTLTKWSSVVTKPSALKIPSSSVIATSVVQPSRQTSSTRSSKPFRL